MKLDGLFRAAFKSRFLKPILWYSHSMWLLCPTTYAVRLRRERRYEMTNSIQPGNCFLCGHPAQTASYNRGNGKAFIECTNKACGEYLITNAAMNHLATDAEKRKEFSSLATSKKEIQQQKAILTISYHGGIKAGFKPLRGVLSEPEISSFGFQKTEN